MLVTINYTFLLINKTDLYRNILMTRSIFFSAVLNVHLIVKNPNFIDFEKQLSSEKLYLYKIHTKPFTITTMSNYNFISSIGHAGSDSETVKNQKAFLTYLAVFMSFGGLIWGTIALYYGLFIQSLIPYSYVVISILNLTYLKFSKKFATVRSIQVFVSLCLPFLFQWSLGGFFSSGMIMLWALLSLLASLSFGNPKSSFVWLFLFVTLTVISGVFDGFFIENFKPTILDNTSVNFTVLNISVITAIVFSLVVYFVNNLHNTQKELEVKQQQVESSNRSLLKAQKVADERNHELLTMKEELLEITKKQTEINKRLVQQNVSARKAS